MRRAKALTVDPKWLVDSFVYYEYLKNDEFGKSIYSDPVTINNVRVDYSTQFTRDKTESKVIANAVIFCFASATTPFLAFKEQSKVTMDGKEYVIQKVVTNKEPYNDTLWSYELEVI